MSELLFGIFDIAERIQKTRKSKPCCHFSKIFFTPYMYCFSPDIIASHFLHAYIVVQPLTNPSSGEVSCKKYVCKVKIIAVDQKIFVGELQSVGDGALGRALLRAESAQPACVQARRGVQRVPSDQTHQRGER